MAQEGLACSPSEPSDTAEHRCWDDSTYTMYTLVMQVLKFASIAGPLYQHSMWTQMRLNAPLACKDCLALYAGTIARTCAATGVGLHLVGPLGFEIDSSRLKRAGLDYWPYVAVNVYSTWQVSLGACGPTLDEGMTRQCHLSHTAHEAQKERTCPLPYTSSGICRIAKAAVRLFNISCCPTRCAVPAADLPLLRF